MEIKVNNLNCSSYNRKGFVSWQFFQQLIPLYLSLLSIPLWSSEPLFCLVISFFLYLCFLLMPPNTSGLCSFGFAFRTFLIPGPFRASTTWAQFLLLSFGNFVHLFTINTHALHTSPCLTSCNLKQFPNAPSYFLLLVNLELKNNNTVMCYFTK